MGSTAAARRAGIAAASSVADLLPEFTIFGHSKSPYGYWPLGGEKFGVSGKDIGKAPRRERPMRAVQPYCSMPQMTFSHQVAGRIKMTTSPGFAMAVLLLQLFFDTKPEERIVETG